MAGNRQREQLDLMRKNVKQHRVNIGSIRPSMAELIAVQQLFEREVVRQFEIR
jgi:hypothetical protein